MCLILQKVGFVLLEKPVALQNLKIMKIRATVFSSDLIQKSLKNGFILKIFKNTVFTKSECFRRFLTPKTLENPVALGSFRRKVSIFSPNITKTFKK